MFESFSYQTDGKHQGEPVANRAASSVASPVAKSNRNSQKFNLFDLQQHLQGDCKLNRTCRDCSVVFDSVAAFQNHLRYSCPFVAIKCSVCGKTYTREQFKQHKCYLERNFEAQKLFQELQGFSDSTMAQGFDQKIRVENQALREQLAASEAQLKQSTAALEHFKKQQDRV